MEINKNKYVKSQSYLENLNCKCMVIDKKDYKDIKCVFKKEGRYILNIGANEGESRSYTEIAKLYIECTNCTKDHKFDFLAEDYKERNMIKNEEQENINGNGSNNGNNSNKIRSFPMHTANDLFRIGGFGSINIWKRESYNVG